MELSRLPLVLLLCWLAGSSTTALPALPGMDRVRQQVDRANRRGPSIGLVMSYVAEDTALQASGYFRPWRVQPFVDLYVTEGLNSLSRPECRLTHSLILDNSYGKGVQKATTRTAYKHGNRHTRR